MKAILTPAPCNDLSRAPRFHVGIEHPDGRQITRFLIRGPWSLSTARRKARELQLNIDAGVIRDPFTKKISEDPPLTEDEQRARALYGDRALTGPDALYRSIKDWG